jgi:alpha-tubulin suppressor-like RCC1 family protein
LTNHFVMPTRIGKETNWTNICAGCYHILALKNDGSLWAWGYNNFGQLGDGTTMSRSVPTIIGTDRDWRTTAVAMFASFALKTNGTLWSWGHGQSNNCLGPTQVGSDTDWLAISACDRATLLALKTDGGLFSMAYRGDRDAFTPVLTQIGRDTDWVEIYAGPGAFWGRKRNGSGRARVESPPKRGLYVPSPPSMPLPLSFDPWAFAPGSRTSLLLSKDGKLWTWGARMGASESTNDQTPHLLWELPPEVRRSLGTGAKGTTSDGTKTQSPNAPEK